MPYSTKTRCGKKCGRAAENFEGEHDFKAFKASGTSSKSTVRTIYKAEVKTRWRKNNNRTYRKWLYVQYGKNNFWNTSRCRFAEKIKPEEIPEIIKSKRPN